MGNQQESLNLKDLIAVPDYDGYYVSEEGKIFSTKRGGYVRRLNDYSHKGRSKKMYMRIKFAGKLWLSHRIIASTLIGRSLKSDEVVNHINGDTTDNRRSNLEVVSQRENVDHAVRAKLYCHGKDWYKARDMQECQESSTTNAWSPERAVKRHECGGA